MTTKSNPIDTQSVLIQLDFIEMEFGFGFGFEFEF